IKPPVDDRELSDKLNRLASARRAEPVTITIKDKDDKEQQYTGVIRSQTDKEVVLALSATDEKTFPTTAIKTSPSQKFEDALKIVREEDKWSWVGTAFMVLLPIGFLLFLFFVLI